MCDDLSFINTTQKTLKSSKKHLSTSRMNEKKLHTWEFQLKGIGGNMKFKLLQKGILEKLQSVPNTCNILPLNMPCNPSSPAWRGEGGGVTILEKSLLAGMEVQNFYFCGGGGIILLGVGARNFEVKIKIA